MREVAVFQNIFGVSEEPTPKQIMIRLGLVQSLFEFYYKALGV